MFCGARWTRTERSLLKTGQHRTTEWDGDAEADLVLNESIGILERRAHFGELP